MTTLFSETTENVINVHYFIYNTCKTNLFWETTCHVSLLSYRIVSWDRFHLICYMLSYILLKKKILSIFSAYFDGCDFKGTCWRYGPEKDSYSCCCDDGMQ